MIACCLIHPEYEPTLCVAMSEDELIAHGLKHKPRQKSSLRPLFRRLHQPPPISWRIQHREPLTQNHGQRGFLQHLINTKGISWVTVVKHPVSGCTRTRVCMQLIKRWNIRGDNVHIVPHSQMMVTTNQKT